MEGGAWRAAVHGVAKSRTQLSDFTFTFYFHALEKEMATHSSVLAWRIPGTGEPGGLPSMGSHRVGDDWSDLAAAAAAARVLILCLISMRVIENQPYPQHSVRQSPKFLWKNIPMTSLNGALISLSIWMWAPEDSKGVFSRASQGSQWTAHTQ